MKVLTYSSPRPCHITRGRGSALKAGDGGGVNGFCGMIDAVTTEARRISGGDNGSCILSL